MKKLINEPGAVVNEILDGMVAVYPELRRLDDTNVLVHDDAPVEGEVAVVSGGRLGHEPTHTGYPGEGVLDDVAVGEVFTSPTADQLNEMIQATDAGESALCVVKNYEGGVMNFDTAAEMAGMEDVDVEQVVANGDVAVKDSLYTSNRRGVADTIFVHKCMGVKAVVGGDLDKVTVVVEKVVDNVRTMGVAFTSYAIPEKGEPTFGLGEDEIELGIGIHGEPGTEHADVMNADEITEHLTENVLDNLDLGEGEEVVTMTNSMGGTPLSELYIVNRKSQSIFGDRGVEMWGAWAGDYMTSLDMIGCPVSILHVDDELKELLDTPAGTSGLTVTE